MVIVYRRNTTINWETISCPINGNTLNTPKG